MLHAVLSWTEQPQSVFSKSNISLPWWTIKLFLPHRLRRKLRSKLRNRVSPASSITALQTSFSPLDTLRSLQSHRWTVYDGQYLILALLGLFSLCIIESPGALVKTGLASLLLLSLLLPITSQFFLPFLPIAAWLVFFYACRFIPGEWRPPIWVKVLPALENIFYGANLSNILSAHQNTFFDLMAWLPYGIIHFGAPVVCTGLIFVFGPPTSASTFARSFGYMNLIGVTIQVLFPCSPPWYENMYGLAPAHYAVPGSPAGLARIDKVFGIDLYTSTFTASPVVFGAFPSLHAGCSTTEALFMSHIFPQLTPVFAGYVLWLWWSTMYLSHHYAVDLVGGSLLAAIVYYFAKANFMPRLQAGKTFRWDYDYIEIGDAPTGYNYELTHGHDSDMGDEWTVASSSSISSGSLSPSEDALSLGEVTHTTEQR